MPREHFFMNGSSSKGICTRFSLVSDVLHLSLRGGGCIGFWGASEEEERVSLTPSLGHEIR